MSKIEIESAFVEAWTRNEEQHPAWGMKTAEPHRRKREGSDEYDTVGRTFRTVKVSRSSGIDLTQFRKGDRVQVWGREVTETREHEGKKFYDLVVWADWVEPAPQSGGNSSPRGAQGQPQQEEPWAQSAPTAAAADAWNTPTSYNDETPF